MMLRETEEMTKIKLANEKSQLCVWVTVQQDMIHPIDALKHF